MTALSTPLPQLLPRAADSHKGNFGAALLIGASRGLSGAIALSGMAAIQSGAGLVRLAVPDRCVETVASYSPCYMTIPLPDDAAGRIACPSSRLGDHLQQASCVAIGPGLGQSPALERMLGDLLPQLTCPVVIDADGLNNLCEIPDWTSGLQQPAILTPHPAEWSRLSGVSAKSRPEQIDAAVEFAKEHRILIALKGQGTLITDGTSCFTNSTGTPAMATGGSGDVLTGLIAALVCQGLEPLEATRLGVHLHGLAGQLAEKRLAHHVVKPTDLIESLPAAFSEHKANSQLPSRSL